MIDGGNRCTASAVGLFEHMPMMIDYVMIFINLAHVYVYIGCLICDDSYLLVLSISYNFKDDDNYI
jgi:hypothetical protein